MPHDWIRFPQCPMNAEEWYIDEQGAKRWRQRIPTPCTHESCQFSEEAERDYVERMRQNRGGDGSPYLRVNGGPGNPWTRS